MKKSSFPKIGIIFKYPYRIITEQDPENDEDDVNKTYQTETKNMNESLNSVSTSSARCNPNTLHKENDKNCINKLNESCKTLVVIIVLVQINIH